jgi:hypothetical protein
MSGALSLKLALRAELPIVHANRAFTREHGYASAADILRMGIGELGCTPPTPEKVIAFAQELSAGRTVRAEMGVGTRFTGDLPILGARKAAA